MTEVSCCCGCKCCIVVSSSHIFSYRRGIETPPHLSHSLNLHFNNWKLGGIQSQQVLLCTSFVQRTYLMPSHYIKHEQKECILMENKNTCPFVWPQNAKRLWLLLCYLILLLWVYVAQCSPMNQTPKPLKKEKESCPNISLGEPFFFFSPSLCGPFQKHLGCCFPLSLSGVVPLICVVHSCSPIISFGASH